MAEVVHEDLVRAVVERYKDRAREYAQAVAAKLGQPLSGQELSGDEMARLWNVPSPEYRQDPEGTLQQAQQMMAQGQFSQAADLVYPWRSQLYKAPTITESIAQAEALHKLAIGDQEGQQDASS